MLSQQQLCADFAALVNRLRRLKHETSGHKRTVKDVGTADLLNVHQVELQSLETLARDLWISLGPQLVAEAVPHVPQLPDRELVPGPRGFVQGMTDDRD